MKYIAYFLLLATILVWTFNSLFGLGVEGTLFGMGLAAGTIIYGLSDKLKNRR